MPMRKGTRRSHRGSAAAAKRTLRKRKVGGQMNMVTHKIYIYRDPSSADISQSNIQATPGLLMEGATIKGGTGEISIAATDFNTNLGKLQKVVFKKAVKKDVMNPVTKKKEPIEMFEPLPPRAVNMGGTSIAVETLAKERICVGTRPCKKPVRTNKAMSEVKLSETGLKVSRMELGTLGALSQGIAPSNIGGTPAAANTGASVTPSTSRKFNICLELTFQQ